MLIDALLVALLRRVRPWSPSQSYPKWIIWLWNLANWTERPLRITRGPRSQRRRALLSYVKKPFQYPDQNHIHPSYRRALITAEVLDEFGFDLDILDFTSDYRVAYSDYELIVGFGQPLFNSFKGPFAGARVYLATGADPNFSNRAEAQRLRS